MVIVCLGARIAELTLDGIPIRLFKNAVLHADILYAGGYSFIGATGVKLLYYLKRSEQKWGAMICQQIFQI